MATIRSIDYFHPASHPHYTSLTPASYLPHYYYPRIGAKKRQVEYNPEEFLTKAGKIQDQTSHGLTSYFEIVCQKHISITKFKTKSDFRNSANK